MFLKEGKQSIKTDVKGSDNSLEIDTSKDYQIELKINGSNNRIKIGRGTIVKKLAIEILGSNNVIEIGEKCNISAKIVTNGDTQVVSIGDKTTFGHATLLARDGKSIKIGEDCMFSTGVYVRTSDSHPVIDIETNMRINDSSDVNIGNHVWVGADAVILKGARIADDSIVGANSLVTKKFNEKNCSIAGFPAKIIKTGVTWSRK